MAIVSTRIDDRLIHGQVASSWLGFIHAKQIICISDKAYKDPIQMQVLKMAAPEFTVHVFGVDQSIRIFKKNSIQKPTFIILDSTLSALHLKQAGVAIDRIHFGGMRKAKERTISYGHDLCFSEEEYAAIEDLFELGVQVDYQVAAYDTPIDLREHIRKAKDKS